MKMYFVVKPAWGQVNPSWQVIPNQASGFLLRADEVLALEGSDYIITEAVLPCVGKEQVAASSKT